MAITVRDVLELDIMKDFKVVAGAKGLDKTVGTTEILDFEFLEEGEEYRKVSFEGNSVVLTSLLFAKDKPELILDAVKKLAKFNVHALAYKPVIYKELPKEVLEFADRTNFPILKFGKDEFFEDLIFQIKELNRLDESAKQVEPLIKTMIETEVSPEEASEILERINPLFRPKVKAICLYSEETGEEAIYEIIKRAKIPDKIQSKTFLGKYEDKILIVLSQDEESQMRFKALLEDVSIAYGLNLRKYKMGMSEIRGIDQNFDKIFKEAFWALKVAIIENEPVKLYKDLGIFKLITAQIKNPATIRYMEDYLAPLFDEEDKESELLKTAITYVSSKGDINKTAEKMFCHKNTIRYRIGKIQEKLDGSSEEKEFYQNLSAAIKIFLLVN